MSSQARSLCMQGTLCCGRGAPAAAESLQFAFSEVLSCLSTLGEESPDEVPLLLGEGGHTVSQSWRLGVEDSRPRLTHPH